MKNWQIAIVVGWLLFLVSFFLPTFRDCIGWEAFFFAGVEGLRGNLFYSTSAMSNLPILLIPFALRLKRKRFSVAMSIIMIAATLLNSLWYLWYLRFPEDRQNFRAGYFLWVTSFAIVSIAITLRARDLHKASAPISN